MKQILSFLLFLLPVLVFAQWPAAPNKIRLGNQTTGDGLIVRTDSIPDWTPADRNNAWLAFDTVANLLYFYEGGTWQEYASGTIIDSLTTTADSIFLYTSAGVFSDALPAPDLSAYVEGSGTTNALAKWLSSTSLGNSLISDDGARITAGGTAGLVLPTGTTAQRSGAPVAGEMRRNTTTGYAESYDGTTWRQEDFPSAANVDRLLRADGSNWIATSTNLLWDGYRLRNYGTGYYAAATFGSINASTKGAPVLGINATSQDGYFAVGGGAGDSTRTRNGILHTSSNLYAGIVGIGRNDAHIRRISANIGVAAASSATTAIGTHIGLYANAYNRNPFTTNTSTMYGVYSSVGALHGNSSYTNAYGVYVVAENLSTIGGGADLWGVVVASSAAKSAFAGNTIIGGTTTPSDTLHVVGTARVTGSSTLPAASVTGRDSLGVFRDVTIGSGLSFTGGTLSATGPAANLGFTGPDTVIELDAGGTSVFIAEGSGVDVTQSGDTLTIAAAGGGVSGSGTTGTIPVWSGATALGDSPLTVTGTDVTAGGTGFFLPPVGTTAQRPGTPSAGMLRYNTTNGAMEYYGASAWEVPLKSATVTGLGTATYVPYFDANGRVTNTSNFVFDNTNSQLKIGVAGFTPATFVGLAVGKNATAYNGGATTTDRPTFYGYRYRNTLTSPQTVQDNDYLLSLGALGYDGTQYNLSGLVDFFVDGTPSAGNTPTRVSITTGSNSSNRQERLVVKSDGLIGIGITTPSAKLHVNGSISRNAPVTKTGNFTVADTENWLIVNNASANTTVTLPTASAWTGREIMLKNLSGTYTVISASSNVVPIDGTSAGTAILPATAGAWCTLVSDGTNWIIMQRGS